MQYKDSAVPVLADPMEITRTFNILHSGTVADGRIFEVRALRTKRATVSGYFNDIAAASACAAEWSREAEGVYVTLNPVLPDLLARAANRMEWYAKHTTSDHDILNCDWLLIDLDSKRPAGVSATDEEHDAALLRTAEVGEWLMEELGWPEPVMGDSGNGGHLLFRINLPNTPEAAVLRQRGLEALALRFSDDAVQVDLKTFNAARISKVYGTAACKGDSTPERPHRVSRLLNVPAGAEFPLVLTEAVVSVEMLKALADTAPTPPTPPAPKGWKGNGHSPGIADVGTYLASHGLTVKKEKPWKDGARVLIMSCPFNPDHDEFHVVQFANGALSARCFHNSCADKDWHDLRGLLEPDAAHSQPVLGKKLTAITGPDCVSYSDLSDTIKACDWDWRGWIPRGTPTLIGGDSGAGKSTVLLAVAKVYTCGGAWLDGQPYDGPTGYVLWCDTESMQALNMERFAAFGIPPDRVLAPFDGVTPVCLDDPNHRARIEKLAEREDVVAIILDSLRGAHRGKENDSDVFFVAQWLAELAQRTNKPVLVTQLPRKRSPLDPSEPSLDWFRGSSAIVQPFRVAWMVWNPTPGTLTADRALVQVKNAISKQRTAFGVRACFDPTSEHILGMTICPVPVPSSRSPQRDAAADFLMGVLAGGGKQWQDVVDAGTSAGYAEHTLRRARDQLKKAAKIAAIPLAGKTTWLLVKPPVQTPESQS